MELDIMLLKKQVRADDFHQDDAYLQHLLDAATDTVVTYTNRKREELVDGEDNLPKMLQQAVLMLAAHWYNQRESVSAVAMHEVPDAVQTLVKPFRRLV
jgi:hypothetical protein